MSIFSQAPAQILVTSILQMTGSWVGPWSEAKQACTTQNSYDVAMLDVVLVYIEGFKKDNIRHLEGNTCRSMGGQNKLDRSYVDSLLYVQLSFFYYICMYHHGLGEK